MKNNINELLEHTKNSVMSEFAKRIGVEPKQIIERNKGTHITDIRHLYCKLRYDMHDLTYTATGREIGRSHSTVKYGVERINSLLRYNDKIIVELWNKVKNIPELYL